MKNKTNKNLRESFKFFAKTKKILNPPIHSNR
jgi:hypothetical protein